MHNSNLNNRSLHSARMKNFMQQGGQPQQQASPNDPMEQLVPAIKAAIEQGMPLAQLILTMAQNNIPMDVIQQGLVVAGIPEQEIMGAMNELQQQQQQTQQEAPIEGPIQPTEGEPAEGQPKMPPVDQVQEGQPSQTPMAQDGAEIQELDDEEMQSREEEPIEELVTDYGDGYHYKKITDPSTGEMTYFTKSAKGKKWRDLQQPGNETPLLSTRAGVFGDNVDEWEGTKAQLDYRHKREMEKLKEIEAYKARKAQKEQEARNASDLKSSDGIPTYQQIIAPNSGYRTKVIKFNKGTDPAMPPGHIETVLIDSKGNPVPYFMDNDNKVQDAFTNRWEEGVGGSQMGYDKLGKDNRYKDYFKDPEKLKGLLGRKGVQSMDITLDSKGLTNFLNQSAASGSQDYHFADNNCADGVCRAYGVDDKNVGQTALIEGLGQFASVPSFLSGGKGALTDPDMVYEYLRKNMNTSNETGKGSYRGRAASLQDMRKQANIMPSIGESGLIDAITPDVLVSPENAKLADYMLGYAVDQGAKKFIDGSAAVYNTAKSAKNSIKDGLNWANEKLGGSPNWWNFQEGGEPSRYGDILNQAQYGMGIDNHLNFNQKFGQDDSFRSNINSAYMPMNLGMKGSNTNLLATVAEGAGRLFGGKDKDGDGLGDGAFRDMKAKRNRHKDTMAVMKGKTPKGLMDNAGDKLMMKYDSETGKYNTAYNDPRYQSNIKKKKYSNLFKKGEKVNTGELLNKPFDYEKEGYKSFNQLKNDMSGLDQNQKDQLQYVADQRSAFETDKKDMPKGMQFGMDSKGGVGYYDKDAELPKDSQENLNKMMMQNYKKGGSFNNPGFKALPESVQQKIMTGIQKGQDGKEIMAEIMESPEMNHVQGQEAIIRKYEDLIRRMQQQHAMEMEQLMMQMQQGQQERGASIGDMMNEADTMTLPPMQMGGGFSLPFAQDGAEVSPSIFNTDEAKRDINRDVESPSQRMAMRDLMDQIKQSQLSQQGATGMDSSSNPNYGSGSGGRAEGPPRIFPNRRTPEDRASDRESRMAEREARRIERGGNRPHGREFRPDHTFTKLSKFGHNIQPWNWSKDKLVRNKPTQWTRLGNKIRQDGGGMVDMSNFMPPQVTDHGMMDPRMMEMQYMNDTAQQMMDPQGQAEMMQQTMSPQQLMQMQQYLEQLLQEIQESSPKGRAYKKLSPHDMDTVELTTEQIAKIMAAGGSVKIV